jgi:NAD(P)-dependent dehydrogenase (short-subunit alcohol dehydrogenase family)
VTHSPCVSAYDRLGEEVGCALSASVREGHDVPLGQLGKPEDVAQMIAFLATSERYISRQNFAVDGELLMR